jgi:hypothetical protein
VTGSALSFGFVAVSGRVLLAIAAACIVLITWLLLATFRSRPRRSPSTLRIEPGAKGSGEITNDGVRIRLEDISDEKLKRRLRDAMRKEQAGASQAEEEATAYEKKRKETEYLPNTEQEEELEELEPVAGQEAASPPPSLDPSAPQSSPPSTPSPTDSAIGRPIRRIGDFCPECGTPIDARTPFCRTCGTQLSGARFVNARFAQVDGEWVDVASALSVGTSYRLRVWIGALARDAIPDKSPMPLPPLPVTELEGHWLEVLLISADADILAREGRYLFVPDMGPSWVCQCRPDGPHRCGVDERAGYLDINVELYREGEAHLRLIIYYQKNAIQSRRLTVLGAASELPLQVGQSFVTDYTLLADLDDMDQLPPRGANILTNETNGDTHRIVINGDDDPIEIRLRDDQVRAAVTAARQSLRYVTSRRAIHGSKSYTAQIIESHGPTSFETLGVLPLSAGTSYRPCCFRIRTRLRPLEAESSEGLRRSRSRECMGRRSYSPGRSFTTFPSIHPKI